MHCNSPRQTVETAVAHPWERAGLGKAPFRWIGMSHRVGPIKIPQADGTTLEIGGEGQPMGTCAYCMQGIAECHEIKSADGKRFIVGCDCVARCNPSRFDAVASAAEAASRKARNGKATARRNARAVEARAELDALLADEAVRARLAALPGPSFGTLLEHADWMAKRAGAAGRGKVLAALKAALA